MKLKVLFVCCLALLFQYVLGQPIPFGPGPTSFDFSKVTITEGEVANIAKIDNLNLVFSYDSLQMKYYPSEADFIAAMEAKHAKKKKKRAPFQDEWKTWKEQVFPGEFDKRFTPVVYNKLFLKANLNSKDADVTLNVRTRIIDPFFRGKKMTNLEIEFIFTDTNGNILLRLLMQHIVAEDGSMLERLADSYRRAGRDLARFLVKNLHP